MFTKCVSTWFSAASVLQSDKYVFQLPSHPKISFKGNILEWPRSVFAQYVDFAQLLAIAQKLLLLTIATKVCSQLCKSLLTKAARKSHGQWGGIYQPSGINDRLIATIPASMWGLPRTFLKFGQNLNVYCLLFEVSRGDVSCLKVLYCKYCIAISHNSSHWLLTIALKNHICNCNFTQDRITLQHHHALSSKIALCDMVLHCNITRNRPVNIVQLQCATEHYIVSNVQLQYHTVGHACSSQCLRRSVWNLLHITMHFLSHLQCNATQHNTPNGFLIIPAI